VFTSSAADLGERDAEGGNGKFAGACAAGILNSSTIKWLIIASTPANKSTPYVTKTS
jgi:hypothetical protein